MAMPKILVVDDDPALLVALREALRLRMPQVNVETCDSASVALERVKSTDYDTIVTDIKMPGMDGLTLLAEIRRLKPDTPTLLITGHGQHDLAVQALRGGAFDFIQKPLDRDYFVASLTRAIRMRQLGRQIEAQQRALEEHATRLEQTVEERTRELREANSAKDEFLAMLAHELRNPLASIRSAVELMGLCRPDDPVREEARAAIERQVYHMTRLQDDLLDISRITRNHITLHKKKLELTSVVASAVMSIRPAAERFGHTLNFASTKSPMPLEGDQTRLEQVVVNLLNNAIKYTPNGGRIDVRLDREGDYALVEIRDTGIGIASEMLPRIFEPFMQVDRALDRAQGGLGLGLTLVRKLVELHGGSVQAQSSGEGCGSAFMIRLPLTSQDPAQNNSQPLRRFDTPSRRVLLVDDNAVLSRMTRLLLEKCGHDVVATAADGPAAIDAASEHRPEVILLDIGLPGMDGYEVARRLRQICDLDQTMLIAVTGYGQEEDRRRCYEAGFDEHVVKPVSVEVLQELLARAPGSGLEA